MDKKLKECAIKLRNLVSDVQGAPYPSTYNNELYTIWHEHIQSAALDALEFLNAQIPNTTNKDVNDIIKKAF